MADYGYDELSEKLIEAIPELRPQYEATLQEWRPNGPTGDPDMDIPGQYIIYEDVLNPYIRQLIDQVELHDRDAGEEILRRIFYFLEELANHPEPAVPNLVKIGVLEAMLDGYIKHLWTYFGPATRQLYYDLEQSRRVGAAIHYAMQAGIWTSPTPVSVQLRLGPIEHPQEYQDTGDFPMDIGDEVRIALLAALDVAHDTAYREWAEKAFASLTGRIWPVENVPHTELGSELGFQVSTAVDYIVASKKSADDYGKLAMACTRFAMTALDAGDFGWAWSAARLARGAAKRAETLRQNRV